MSKNQSIFDRLQHEFCPSLDSSLIAALVGDLESDQAGTVSSPSPRQIDGLRATLRELAAQADLSQLCEVSDLQVQVSSPTDTSSSSHLYCEDYTTGPSSLTSSTSQPSQDAFSSPLGFLQAALPHVATKTLSSALKNADVGELDLWDVVAGILTAESIREMEERGLEGLDGDEDLQNSPLRDEESKWQTVGAKKTTSVKRKNIKGNTLILSDVRQQQRKPIRPVAKKANTLGSSVPDPWTQLSSLSSHLATLLPPHQPSFFQSYFHSPDHQTPYIALRACLASICKAHMQPSPEEHTDTLFILLDILLPDFQALSYDDHNRLISDIEIVLQATHGNGDDSLDLIKLLRDLDADSSSYLEMGVYHTNPPPSVMTKPKPRQHTLPSQPPPIPPPPQSRPKPKPPPSPSTKINPSQWQSIPKRHIPHRGPHPLAQHIPAYNRDVNGNKVKGAGNTFGQGGRGDVGELGEHRRRMRESMRKRDEMLRRAAWMWQRGNSNNRGGEVALYFAERAREFQEVAKKEALEAARSMVESKRLASNDPTTVDLHGTTAAEAVILVKEILNSEGSSPSKPLKIITGRGAHSVNQVSVLKPAIRKALLEDGWVVGTWDGGLVVRGKR